VDVRILLFLIAVLFFSACNAPRQATGDFTKNNSRSNNEVAVKSRNKSSHKASRKSDKTYRGSSEEYLDAISAGSSSGSMEESKAGNSNAGKAAANEEYHSSGDKSSGSIDDSENNGNANERLTSDLIREADKVIGVKYRYGGTSPQRGFDCSGFTAYVFSKAKIDIPRTSTDQSRSGKRKKFKDARVGDLVFFGTGNRVTHVGIVVSRSSNKMEVIHSTSSSGVRRDEIFGSEYWNSRKLWAIDFESLRLK
jgi:cell wall-associated NlpC family hydrolase